MDPGAEIMSNQLKITSELEDSSEEGIALLILGSSEEGLPFGP